MKPVKIKAYGFLPLSKSVFLGIQAFGFSVLAAALVLFVLTPPPMDRYRKAVDPEQNGIRSDDPKAAKADTALFFIELVHYAPWFVLGGIAIGVVETGLILRKFRQKEDALRK